MDDPQRMKNETDANSEETEVSNRQSGTSPDGPDSQQTDATHKRDKHRGAAVTRRNVLITSTTAGLFGASGAGVVGGASAETDDSTSASEINIVVNEVLGSNQHRSPHRLELDEWSTFQFEADGFEHGDVVLITLEFRPHGDEHTYEEIAQEGFIVDANNESDWDYEFNAGDLHEEERDLSQHSEITVEGDGVFGGDRITHLAIDSDIIELVEEENRTIMRQFDFRVRALDESDHVISEAETTIDATYGLRGGAGVRFGYNFLQVAPNERMREQLIEQEENN